MQGVLSSIKGVRFELFFCIKVFRVFNGQLHFFSQGAKPMGRFFLGSRGVMSSRMASKTALNWMSYFFSSVASLRESSALEESICRKRTKARMISMLTWMARSLCKTLESMDTPCSVKAYGAVRIPPQLEITIWDFKLEVPDWNLKFANSSDAINFLSAIASPLPAAFYTIAAQSQVQPGLCIRAEVARQPQCGTLRHNQRLGCRSLTA
jgi:hypothetical protein